MSRLHRAEPDRRRSVFGGPLDAVALQEFLERIINERSNEFRLGDERIQHHVVVAERHLREHIVQQIEQIKLALVAADRLEDEKIAGLRARDHELTVEIRDEAARLREHILAQIGQIQMALEAADKLEHQAIQTLAARIDSVESLGAERLAAMQREANIVTASAHAAIAKAEAANEVRFASVNEFRRTLADQTNSFLPREVADAQAMEMRKAIEQNSSRLSVIEGRSHGVSASLALAMTLMGFVIVIAIAVANYLSSH